MKEKILIIDDMEFILTSLEIFFSQEGYDVSTACSYREAMEKMSGTDFNLVLTDIGLGGKTGIDVLKEVRKKDRFCPVILFTGAPDTKTETEAKRMGAYDYLSKPVERATLLRSVRMALRHRIIYNDECTGENR
ncbi:MAG: response regulator [Candidatus Scalindua sp.]|nr:response regulator [Candidatus Scalindua sp.]